MTGFPPWWLIAGTITVQDPVFYSLTVGFRIVGSRRPRCRVMQSRAAGVSLCLRNGLGRRSWGGHERHNGMVEIQRALVSLDTQSRLIAVERGFKQPENFLSLLFGGAAVLEPFVHRHANRALRSRYHLESSPREQALKLGFGQRAGMRRVAETLQPVVIRRFVGVFGSQHIADE